jgi:pyruvate/2-oxoglutarate dehydrogenase complex dihydrolipoamide dehydrogenase (E3) component
MSAHDPRVPLVLPDDEHNRTLVDRVHPPSWVNPQPAGRYNLVVVGAGTAGLVCAAGAAGLGARVAIVERHLMGGDCLNYGCVPSKTLIRSARAAADARDAARFGIRLTGEVDPDFTNAMTRVRAIRSAISRHDSVERFRGLGVDVFLGQAAFVDRGTLRVEGRDLRFSKAVIATGARPIVPDIPGLASAGCLTNETVFSLTERPRRLAVIGAGPIGCELAQAFRRLGSEVTLVQRSSRMLPREDPEAGALLARAFARDGVDVRLGTTVTRVTLESDATRLHLVRGGQAETVDADHILVGAGRAPNVEDLGLDAAGVAWSPDGVTVDDRLRTTNHRIYAAGDVCLPWKFTHAADAAARIVIQNALFLGRRTSSALTIPWCTYTDPEIARVGLNEHDAQQRGLVVDAFTVRLADVDRAVTDGDENGFVRIVVPRGRDTIAGATIAAPHAGEMIGELTLAMVAGLGLGTLSSVIHPYPTVADAIRKAADAYRRTKLTPSVRRLFEVWFRWTR